MKIVVNDCFGGFSLSPYAANCLGFDTCCPEIPGTISQRKLRTDPRLIEMVEKDSIKTSGIAAELKVVEIPDEVTDWMVDEYDGNESIIYVLDGKLHRAFCAN